VATIVAGVCFAFCAGQLYGQAQVPAQRPAAGVPTASQHGIAVIDVTYILEHYSRLKQAMEVYKRDAQGAEDVLKKERGELAKRAERIKTLKPGSPDFKAEEEAITKAESDWKLKVAAQRRDFAERESKNYLRAYQELSEVVKEYAQRNGISLVLRFNGAPIDPNNREMVQMEVFKMVMYYDKSIDITDPVLAELNRKAAIASPGGPRRN
jgi:Skp family chaperone for outer membrane proteins